MSKTQDEQLFDAIKQDVMELINSYRPHEDDEYQTTLERYFWNWIESNAGEITESVIEEDLDAYAVYLGEEQEDNPIEIVTHSVEEVDGKFYTKVIAGRWIGSNFYPADKQED